MMLVEVLTDMYRELGWDVQGYPPRPGAPGTIETREIDAIASAIEERLRAVDDEMVERAIDAYYKSTRTEKAKTFRDDMRAALRAALSEGS